MKSFLEILPLENIPSSDEFVHKKSPPFDRGLSEIQIININY